MHENYFPNCEVFMTLELKKPIFSVEYKTEVANLNNLLYLRSTCTPEINLDQRSKNNIISAHEYRKVQGVCEKDLEHC